MKWIAIAGAVAGVHRKINSEIENNVRKVVREIIARGDGIVSGGALGIDYIATDEALLVDGRMYITIPSTLESYCSYIFQLVKEVVITEEQAQQLAHQLAEVKKRGFLVEGMDTVLNKDSFFNHIIKIIDRADELVAFHINQSEGTQDTIDKARKKGIPVTTFNYSVEWSSN